MSDQDDLLVREYDEPTQAVTVRDAVAAVERLSEPPAKPQVTAAQAKIEAVAQLTAAAYSKASELKLTPEEIKALQADFPDEAFKSGAAGKEALIYIEHAFLRDRLIGPAHLAGAGIEGADPSGNLLLRLDQRRDRRWRDHQVLHHDRR